MKSLHDLLVKYKIKDNELLTRGALGIVAGIFLVMTHSAITVEAHVECTNSIRIANTNECIGEYIRVPGPDKLEVAFLALITISTAWYSIAPRKEHEE